MMRLQISGFSVTVLVLAVFLGQASAAHIAYNDCVYSSNNTWTDPDHPVLQPNVTTFGVGYRSDTSVAYSPTSGLLKDFATGQTFGVTATMTASSVTSSGVKWQPGQSGSGGIDCNAGTDADKWFGADTASLYGTIYYASSTGWWVDVTFTGLDPNKAYTFVTTANRNGSTYVGTAARPTKYVVSDLTGFAANNGSLGVTKSTTTITNDTTTFNTGYNTVNGYVAMWSYIKPGTDGDFKVRASSGGTQNEAYTFDAFCLIEEVPEPATVALLGLGGLTGLLRRRHSCSR
jgi:hypothetical protein